MIVFPNRSFFNPFLHDSICYLTYYLQFLYSILDTFIQYHYYHSQHHYNYHQGFYEHLYQIFRGTLESFNGFLFSLFQSVWSTLMLQHYSTSEKVPTSYEWKSFFCQLTPGCYFRRNSWPWRCRLEATPTSLRLKMYSAGKWFTWILKGTT